MHDEKDEVKHTPGPWTLKNVPTQVGMCYKIGPFPATGYYKDETYACLYVDGRKPGESLNQQAAEIFANARLIAAAPDLLGVLKGASCDLGTVTDYLLALNDQESADLLDVVNGLVERIEAAIAKAEGKAPAAPATNTQQ